MHKGESLRLCTAAVFRREILTCRLEILIFNSEREERWSAFAQRNTHQLMVGLSNRREGQQGTPSLWGTCSNLETVDTAMLGSSTTRSVKSRRLFERAGSYHITSRWTRAAGRRES
jgi:hypothetical protein